MTDCRREVELMFARAKASSTLSLLRELREVGQALPIVVWMPRRWPWSRRRRP